MDAKTPTPPEEMLLEHTEFVRMLARSLLRDEHEAEDVAQETVLAALRRPPRPGNLRSWLGKVARNLALTARRDMARRRRREQRAARTERLPAVDEGVARLELQRRLVDAVLALKDPYRSVIVHRFFYGHGLRETARLLGVPLETVRTRQRRALERLRACLDEGHGRSTWSLALVSLAAPQRHNPTSIMGALAMTGKLKIAIVVIALAALAWLTVSTRDAKGTVRRSRHSKAPLAEQRDPIVEESAAASEFPPVDFAKIDRDRDVFGTVVGDDAGPIADADVTALRLPLRGATQLSPTESNPMTGPATRTAHDGTFRLRLARGEEVMLRVRAMGYAPLLRQWCTAGGRVRIVMDRVGATLEVHAVNEQGQPVAEVHLALGHPQGARRGAVDLRGVTDQDGRYLFQNLVASKGRAIFAWHRHFAVQPLQRVDVPGRTKVRVAAGRTITGHVIDAETRAPVVGATVSSSSMLPDKAVTTDMDGRFTYEGWSAEGHRGGFLYAWADEFAVARANVKEKTRVDFLLQRGDRATGRVRTFKGTPVAGGFVSAIASHHVSGAQQVELRETRTHPDGTFVLTGLRRDLPHTLVVQRPGGVRLLLDFDPVPNGPGTVKLGEIVLPEGRRVEGRILKADGRPLAGVRVELRGANHDRDRFREEPAQADYGTEFTRRTDDLGRFRFKEIAPGRYGLSALASDGHELAHVVVVEQDVIDLELRLRAGGEIPVRIVDEAGHGVQGVTVSVHTGSSTTDEQGRATLRLPAGEDRTIVSVQPSADRFVAPRGGHYYNRGQGELLVVLHRAATVGGRILAPDGRGLEGAFVVATTRGGFRASSQAVDGGHFTVRVPAGALVDLKLTGDIFGKWQPLVGALANVPADSKSVELQARTIATDRHLRIRVVAPDGTGVEKVELSVVPAPHTGNRMVFPRHYTDEEGRLEVSGLPALNVVVIMLTGDKLERWAPPKSTYVRVMPQGQEIVFALRKPNPIRGVVVLPDGTGTRVAVVAYRGDDILAQALSDANGSFTLNVPAEETDPVRLQVHPQSAAGGTETLFAQLENVPPGAEGLRVELNRR